MSGLSPQDRAAVTPSDGLLDGTRLRVVSGRPTADELAAVVAAVDAARRADSAARRPRSRPAWLRAARTEAVRGRRVASPADLGGTGAAWAPSPTRP